MVVHALPSPRQAQLVRAPSILHGAKPDFSTVGEKVFKAVSTNPETAAVEEAIAHCRSDDAAPLAVFVAKMVAVAPESFPTNRRIQLTAEELRARRQKAKCVFFKHPFKNNSLMTVLVGRQQQPRLHRARPNRLWPHLAL